MKFDFVDIGTSDFDLGYGSIGLKSNHLLIEPVNYYLNRIPDAAGLPMMECAAAGRLPLGTPVGYFEENAPQGGGILLPLDEAAFVQEAQVQLNFYRENKMAFIGKCKEIKEYALEYYDWRVKIAPWIKLFCE